MQLMTAPSGGDAREVGLAEAAGRGSDTSYVQLPPGSGAEAVAGVAVLRKQVLMISGLMAAVIIVGLLVEAGLDAVEVGAMVNEVKDAGAPGVSSVTLLGQNVPATAISVVMVLSTVACGCCGAKQENRRAAGCFSCCNALCGCCSCISMMALMGGFTLLGSVSSQVDAWVERCDPIQCMPPEYSASHVPLREGSKANLTCATDCLAVNMWDDYLQHCRTPDSRTYPKGCPKTFLECEHEDKRMEWSSPRAKKSMEWSSRRLGRHGRGENPFAPGVPWRPVDPLRACKPNVKAIEKFHRVTKVLPDLWPRVRLMVGFKLVVEVISTILLCVGAKWGWDLYQELGVQCMPGLPGMQPAVPELAPQVAMATPFEEGGTLERSLVLHAPPSPLTL